MQLDEVSNRINELTVGQPENKNTFCKHIEKVIREAERHRQYLLEQQLKAKEAGWVFCDESKDRDEWTWLFDAYSDICKHTYFTEDEWLGKKEIPPVIQFYIAGKPKPNPLDYLESMIWACRGAQVYKGLKLLDYQFVLLAIIHDAQYSDDGQERIYFNKQEKKILSNRLCGEIWEHLVKSPQIRYGFPMDVQQTIETALLAVKAELAKEKQAKGAKYWFKFVCQVVAGVGILLGILWTAIQIYESVTFKQFVASRPQLQSVYDPNAQTESNDITLSSKTSHDTSNSLPDSNLSFPESPNQ